MVILEVNGELRGVRVWDKKINSAPNVHIADSENGNGGAVR